MKEIKISIAGASGITGIELIKILDRHKHSKIISALSRTYEGKEISKAFKNILSLKNNKKIYFKSFFSKSDIQDSDLIFLCLPPGKSMEYTKYLMENGYNGKIIDIGSDFRLNNADDYEEWYGEKHILKEMLPKFVYGLPELNKEAIKNADYLANPGCYPTSIILALAPIIDLKSLKFNSITIDSKSGVSGAGRKLKDEYLFLNIADNFFAYSPLKHRHIPEIEQELSKISGSENKISFTPHLLPINRGIFTSIYLNGVNIGEIKELKDKINDSFNNFYRKEAFIKLIDDDIPKISNVSGTNSMHISFLIDCRTSAIKIFSAIDNILKGAAGQAVQNMNLMFGLNETEGLDMQGISN
jgi:N-acetyl-gamma-glutamyl-phosphate reductase